MGKETLAAIREREIYARIDRILCHKHIEFALEHQKDSLETSCKQYNLLFFLKS